MTTGEPTTPDAQASFMEARLDAYMHAFANAGIRPDIEWGLIMVLVAARLLNVMCSPKDDWDNIVRIATEYANFDVEVETDPKALEQVHLLEVGVKSRALRAALQAAHLNPNSVETAACLLMCGAMAAATSKLSAMHFRGACDASWRDGQAYVAKRMKIRGYEA